MNCVMNGSIFATRCAPLHGGMTMILKLSLDLVIDSERGSISVISAGWGVKGKSPRQLDGSVLTALEADLANVGHGGGGPADPPIEVAADLPARGGPVGGPAHSRAALPCGVARPSTSTALADASTALANAGVPSDEATALVKAWGPTPCAKVAAWLARITASQHVTNPTALAVSILKKGGQSNTHT
jgi:hypothetical protein